MSDPKPTYAGIPLVPDETVWPYRLEIVFRPVTLTAESVDRMMRSAAEATEPTWYPVTFETRRRVEAEDGN